VDERAFEVLRRIRAGQGQGLSLQQFKALLREQFFSLLLDQQRALAAIPKMLSEDTAARNDILEKIRRVVSAGGKPGSVRAQRLAEIEQLFGKTVDEGAALKKRISLVE
jgi:DNA-binding transcriptional MerR regulator